MKKTMILIACMAVASVFAEPAVGIRPTGTGPYSSYDFVVNEACNVTVAFSFTTADPSNPGNFSFDRQGFYDLSTYYPSPSIGGGMSGPGGPTAHFNAGDAFGIWAIYQGITTETSPFREVRYELTSPMSLSLWYHPLSPTYASFSLGSLTVTDTGITGYGDITHDYYNYNYGMVDSQTVTVGFRMVWTPDAAPTGQPLPGVRAALAIGGGAYVARRRKRKA